LYSVPIPPCHKLINLFLFIGIFKKVEDRVVKVFRVSSQICARENWGGAKGEADLKKVIIKV
jgi:hypothetical protein